MSKTLMMKDGDLFFDEVSGRPREIDGYDKCAQDLAEVILTVYDTLRDFGSELNTMTENPGNYGGLIGKGMASKYVSDSVRRLMAHQNVDSYIKDSEKIVQISKVFVKNLSYDEIFFYLEVENAGAEIVSSGFKFVPTPVSLEQLNYSKTATLDSSNGQPYSGFANATISSYQ